MHDDDLGVRVADHVLELGRRVRHSEGDGDATGPPHAPLRRDVGEARRRQEGDADLREVVASGEQTRGDTSGGVEQVAVGERTFGRAEGRALTVGAGSGDEGKLGSGRHGASAYLCVDSLPAAAWNSGRYCPYPSASSRSTGMKRSAAELMQ